MRIRDKVDSDHQPIEVWIKGRERRKQERKGKRGEGGIWNKEGRNMFR